MTDKEKIRLEILRRRDSLSPFDYVNEAIEWNLLDNLLNYIDSLPERIKAEDVIEVPELTELEKKAKIYAIEQVLCTTDTRMTEQAYLSLRIFNGYDVACAYKDGAESHREQMMKEACEWLKENIWKRLYVCDGEAGFPTAEFLKDFRKAMEDEQ